MRPIFKSLALTSVMAVVTAVALTPASTPALGQTDAPPEATQSFGPRKGTPGPGGAQGPKSETIATHGSWQVQCADAPGADGQPSGQKACGMVQVTKNDKNENIQLSVIVSRVKRDNAVQTVMRVIVPIGVYLPTGIPIEIDGAALPNRLVFTRCAPRVCEAYGEASEESLKKFMKGNDSVFYLYDRPGNGYPLKISLAGFAAAIGELDKQ